MYHKTKKAILRLLYGGQNDFHAYIFLFQVKNYYTL